MLFRSEDQYGRVEVSCPALWEEKSTLLPVLNNVFISKGDKVVLFSPENLQQSIFILGRFQTESVQVSEPIDTKSKPVLFKALLDDTFMLATLTESNFHIETDKGLIIDITSDSVDVVIPGSFTSKTEGDVTKEIEGGLTSTAKGDIAISTSGGSLSITSAAGKELFTCLSALLDKLNSVKPTTLGSPSAQNFNPGIVAALQLAKQEMDSFQ